MACVNERNLVMQKLIELGANLIIFKAYVSCFNVFEDAMPMLIVLTIGCFVVDGNGRDGEC